MIPKTRSLRSVLLAALLGGAASSPLFAQTPAASPPPHGPGGPGGHHGPPSVLFETLDTNHDGVISATEINNATASLKTLLKNGATEITRDDLRPPHPPRGAAPSPGASPAASPPDIDLTAPPAGSPPPRQGGPGGHGHHGPPPVGPLFEALDADHDGVISAAEIENAPAELKTLLKNGATQLTHADLRPQHPPEPPADQ